MQDAFRPALRHTLRTLVALLLPVGTSAALDLHPPEEPTSPTVQLPEVTVRGKLNAFEESDRKLRQLMEGGPCLGCDNTVPPPPPSLVEKVLDTAVYLITPQQNQPVDNDARVETEMKRAEFEKRLPTNRNP
ncbi:hypothetical protein [uncultured Nevskia sp.]|uniref:hypothetical protein n=1 Tax=uncultured Nevskia sp. TaxID=228950 RepID=UPI0025DD53EC|nr:hypothetical protein [uncultured Nevskia sp.]